MNHIHRLVWNEQTGSWVAVSETARSRGKGGARSARKAFMAALIASGFAMAPALAELPATTVVPASGKTNAYISANGVPVVNIETANAKGLSHNFYTTYNVETNGLVLNNGNNSQVSRQSQLAGQVVANLNLVQEAKVILNEVVSTNRSALAGFTEVLGGRADVIVANPNGITCNGCGFINTDRVTLTTGTANVAIDGSLTGFNVNRGDLLIEGLGANASTQQIFDLVARSVKLDGKVNVPATHSLGITTGHNVWSYAGRNVTGSVAGSGAAPTYAFDSTALGGMYAGRINIIATEAGVGVRMLGDAAASADDFTLSSAGKVEIQSSFSAARDVSLASSSATGSNDLFLNGAGATVSAGRDVSLGATAGQVRLVEAELFATRDLSISGASLSDVATDVSNVATDAKTRFAGGNTSLVTSGAAVIDGSVWGAGSALSGAFSSLAIGATGATLYAGSTLGLSTVGDMSLATAAVRSTGDMTLAASAGAISVSAGAEQGIQTTAGNLSLSAGNGLSNDGTLTADAGSVTARINGLLNNSGTVHAKTALDVADQSGGTSENVTNSGTFIADGALTAKAASFTNQASGTVQGTTGTTLTATTLTNAGTFIASSTAGQSGTFTLASLINSGTLQSAQDLTFNASAALTNSGKLLASHDLSVLAGSAALAISNTFVDANQPGVIQAGNALTMTGANATFNTQSGTVLANTVALTLDSLNNAGTLQSNAGMTYSVDNGVSNSGTLLAKTTLTGASGSLNNTGTLQANLGSTITTTGALTNSGSLIASESASQGATLNVGTLSNTGSGVIQSAQNLALNVSGSSLTNAGTVIAADDLTLNSTGSGLTVTNQSGGYLQSGTASGDTLTVGGTAVVLDNNAGAYILGDQLVLNLTSLNNVGTIQGGEAVSSLTTSGALTNTGTLTLATSGAASSSIAANSLDNSGTLQSGAGMNMTVANAVVNSGTLYAAKNLTSQSASLNNTGTWQADQGSTVTATWALTNTGNFIASGSASYGSTLNVGTLSNSAAGVIQSAQSLAVNLNGSTLNNASKIIAADDLTLTSTGSGLTLTNQPGGYLQAGSGTGDTLTVGGNAVMLNNNTGASILGDQIAMNLASLTNAGTVQGGTAASTLTASGTVTNTGTLNLASTSAGSGTITADTLTNSGTLQSQGAASINVATQLTNSGSLLTAGAMTVRGTDSAYTVSQTGRMQSGGLMSIKGQSGGNGVDITVGGSGVLLGDSLEVNAGTLTVNNGGMVSSMGNMTLAANTLSFGGVTSRIVAANSGTGNANITLANSFSNVGAVHSSDNLVFRAPSITNTNSGGFSALNTLTLQATAGNLNNAGALYAGSQLNASASGNLTNAHTTGTMDSGGSMSLTAGATFTNNGDINAAQDINVVSVTFRNEIPGGVPARVWGATSWGSRQDDGYDYNGESWAPGDEWWYYKRVGTRSQSFATTPPSTKPQIIAGRNMRITGFTSAKNTGAVMAASSGTMTISGTGTFTNDDLSLETENFTEYWHTYKDWGFFEDTWHYNRGYNLVTTSTTARSYGAGIFANTLNASGFSLVNQSSAWAASPNSRTATGASGTSLSDAENGTTGTSGTTLGGTASGKASGSGVSGVTSANGKPAISFGGLVITLPTNPNGYFVLSQSPGAKYLVETNPLFSVGSNFVGSDYMARRYGYNPDTVIKLLGDANYEAYLIRQQLISQTGNNLIAGYGNEADQMKRLMDQAVVEGKRSGFSFGQALTSDQIANLKEDVVWMVETTVAGQKVLAPVVYLAASTRNAIETGAVIAAQDVNLDLTALTNTGGTISGAKSLTITSQGDITNTSGTIKGGNVALKSVEGSIKNETLVSGSGNSENYATTIGKTAGITATGNLALEAKKDITVKGGDVAAGGDAALTAGGNVTFDTIVDKSTSTTRSTSGFLFNNSKEKTTTTTENNVGSNLTTGGNLTLKSGGDTTIAGSKATVGGDLNVDAGGSFNVLARQDKTTTKSESTTSGLGVGGGLAGTEKTTVDSFKGTNSGSTLTVGGNAAVKAEKEMTVQGSDVKIAGDADIYAKQGINILDGLNEERTTTRTETTTFLKMDNAGEKGSSSGANSGSKSGAGNASASANAQANAEASGTSDLKLAETTVSTTQAGSNTSVSSNFTVGGNLIAKTEGTLKVQGSNVEAGGDMALDAKNVEVLTGRNEEWSNNQTTRTSVGIYNEGDASANAQAQAQAKAGTAGTDASASAGANAEAGGTTTIGARTENEESTAYKLTNSSSTLKSGGNLSIKAKEDAKFVGANVESGGDMTIEAKNISNLAAQDIETNTSTKTTQTAGFYVDGKAGAEAKAEADAGKINIGGMPANAEASAEAKADVSAGVRYKNEQESSSDGSVTQVTSSFKAGGNLTRNATDTITDQGTQIEAGGNINQTAREIKEIEANNSSYSTSDSSSHDAKIGVGASASAEAGANSKGEAEADAGAGAGFRAKYAGSIESESESSSTAVTSKYKAGGNVNSTSTEKTTLIGTTFETGGDVNINAGSLDFKAAKDTSTQQSSTNEINAELKVDVVGKAGGSLAADYANTGDSEKSSTARTGSINAGGNLNIKTTGDTTLEGTQLEAGGKASIAAGGTVDFKAARDTSESKSTAIDASLELSTSKGAKGVEASAGYSQEDSSSSKAQTGSIKAGSGGISVSAGKDANFEGTTLKSDGDTAIGAGGNVNLKAAKNTETTTSFGVEASLGAEKGDEGSKQSGSIGGSAAYANTVDSDKTSIQSGGTVTIKGNNVVNQEAAITGKDGTSIVGNEVKIRAEKSDVSIGLEVKVSGEKETKNAE